MIETVTRLASRWLDAVPDRPIPPTSSPEAVRVALTAQLPVRGNDAEQVLARLAAAVEPGLMGMQSSRFFGWVIGGTFPVALGADWLVTAWDQNAGMRMATPGVAAVEEAAGDWVLDLLGLPSTAAVGFVTGATAANTVGLTAGRNRVLAEAGWDADRDGLAGGPRVRLIAGAERHGSLDLAARYAGLGRPTLVGSDREGRIRVDDLARMLDAEHAPTIVCLQAGNLHSGAFDDFAGAISVAHAHGAWVHIDGAFGLWAAASGGLRRLTAGYERADSWATDAHKTLNVPYDSGIAIVADPVAVHSAFGLRADYLRLAEQGADPMENVPEMSRRARGVPIWATMAWLGRQGVEELVQRLADNAAALAVGLAVLPGVTILNAVVYTQVCLAMSDDASTAAVASALEADGGVFASPSRWRDRTVLRFSVSNWGTDAPDIEQTIGAVRRAIETVTRSAG